MGSFKFDYMYYVDDGLAATRSVAQEFRMRHHAVV